MYGNEPLGAGKDVNNPALEKNKKIDYEMEFIEDELYLEALYIKNYETNRRRNKKGF